MVKLSSFQMGLFARHRCIFDIFFGRLVKDFLDGAGRSGGGDAAMGRGLLRRGPKTGARQSDRGRRCCRESGEAHGGLIIVRV